MLRQSQQMRRQLARGLAAQVLYRLGRVRQSPRARFLDLGPLPLDPGPLLLGE
jgi:hypothetical protein